MVQANVSAADKLRAKANEAIQAQNYDYAKSIYQQILSLHPDSAADRKSLRTVQRKVFLEKGGKGAFGKFMGKTLLMKLEAVKLSKNPGKIMDEAEKVLDSDPFDATALKAFGHAANDSQLWETAIYTFEDILERDAKDIDALRALGALWYDRDRKKASGFFERIRRLRPDDKEAHEAIRDLAAKMTMDQGVEKAALGTGDYHDMLKNKEAAQRREDEQRVSKTASEIERAIEYAKADIAKSPKEPRHWAKLADEYVKMRDFAQAREAMTRACKLDDANLSLQFKLGDVVLKEFDVRIQEAQEAQSRTPDDEAARAAVQKLRADKLATAIQDFAHRVKAYPTDLDLRYRYGVHLSDAGRTQEAIPELQHAVNDPKRKRPALIRLGTCFMREGMMDLAEHQLLKALEGKHVVDDESKLVYYYLGMIYEKLGKADKAREAYQKILEVDFAYKDVADRLKRIGSTQG